MNKKPFVEIHLSNPSEKAVLIQNDRITAEHLAQLFMEYQKMGELISEFLPDECPNVEQSIEAFRTIIGNDKDFLKLFESEFGRGYLMGCLAFFTAYKKMKSAGVFNE